jgi:hypothetical protein
MFEVAVIAEPGAAEVALDLARARLPADPGSATALAAKVALPRQRMNYHLERHGLIELVEERRRGNVNDRVMRAAATSYVISPAALAAVQPDPSRSPDRLSARWLLAVAARLVRDVAELVTGAARARRRIATFAIDGEVRFASAADRPAFAVEPANAVSTLVSQHHDATAEGGREHRVVVHPTTHTATKADQDTMED